MGMPFPTLFTMMLRLLLLVHTVAFLRMKEYHFSRSQYDVDRLAAGEGPAVRPQMQPSWRTFLGLKHVPMSDHKKLPCEYLADKIDEVHRRGSTWM